MSIFNKLFAWFKKVFVSAEKNAAHIAVAIGEVAKESLNNGTLDVMAKVVDFIAKSNLGDEIELALKASLPKIIAVSNAVQTFPTKDSTEADVLAWEKSILDGFNIHDNKSVLYTTIAAQTFGVLNSLLKQPGRPTFSAWVAAVEEIYQDYQKDTAQG